MTRQLTPVAAWDAPQRDRSNMLNGARMAKRSRVLATGGGFIGRAMVSALLARGHEVTVTDPDQAACSVPAPGAGAGA
jgi:xanthine/CO dehydrogenase XdhC/CoxF family maturation factor